MGTGMMCWDARLLPLESVLGGGRGMRWVGKGTASGWFERDEKMFGGGGVNQPWGARGVIPAP